MATPKTYQLHLKGFVGGYDFDADYVDYILSKNSGKEVHVLIDSLGGKSNTALSIFSSFKRHGNVNVHFVGMNASAATINKDFAKDLPCINGNRSYRVITPIFCFVIPLVSLRDPVGIKYPCRLAPAILQSKKEP